MSKAHLEAVIWDMDGVIADTADYHYNAWREVLAERGVTLTKADFMKLFGQRHDTIIKFALGDNLPPDVRAPLDALISVLSSYPKGTSS